MFTIVYHVYSLPNTQLNKVDLEDSIIAPLMLQWFLAHFLYLLQTVGKRAAVVSPWMRVSSLPRYS